MTTIGPSSRPAPTVPRGQQREIAQRAGVSVSTVSRVLNNVPGISAELKERVRIAAGELGYVINQAPRLSPLRRVALFSSIGRFTSRVEPFYHGIVSGIEAECQRHGIELTYTAFDPKVSNASFVLENISKQSSVGLLLLAVDDRAFIEQVLATTHPVVVVNAEHPELPVDTFLPDNWRASYQAVRTLIQRGHRRIMHVTYAGRLTIQRREQAYRAALADAGIANDPSLVLTFNERETDAAYAIRTYLTRGDRDFTAVFCCDDATAIEMVHALQESGLRVPEDVSVIGFDDVPLASLIVPPLTTVRIEREELGIIAVRRLIERAVEPQLTPVRVELACRLIERQSVAVAGPPDVSARARRLAP